MTWPTTSAGTGNLDASSDDPRAARADLLQAVQNVNAIKDHVSTQGQDLIAATTQSGARTVIDAQEQTVALDALKVLTPASAKGVRFIGSNTAETFDLTDAAKAALAGVDNTAILSALGVVLNDYLTAVEAGETYQPYNALLNAILALSGTGIVAKTGTSTAELRQITDIQYWNTAGTYSGGSGWQKPTGAKSVNIFLLGGYAGGGAGRRSATGVAAFGGGGASMPGWVTLWGLEADMFASQEAVVIGAKGVGGAGVTADSTNGNAGTDGGDTTFGASGYGWTAKGGKGGAGGTTTTGTGGAQQFVIGICNDSNKGQDGTAGGSGVTAAPSNPADVFGMFPTSSGSGGGIDASNVAYAGQNGPLISTPAFQTAFTRAAGGANTGAAGANGQVITMGTHRKITIGAGGGGANLTGAGGAGGVPGGGGGASRNGNASGKGGDGLDGICVVITYCGV